MTDSSDVFFRDLARGQEVERQVLKIIQKKCPCACIIDKFHGYDIWIPELHKSVEVKYDHMSCETGNIFIEIEYNKKASALMTTTADWWVIYDEKKYMMFTPKEIIRCIFINQLVHRHCIGRGDVKSKRGFLVEKKLLFQYGKEIK